MRKFLIRNLGRLGWMVAALVVISSGAVYADITWGASTAAPAYTRLQSGVGTTLAAVNGNGGLQIGDNANSAILQICNFSKPVAIASATTTEIVPAVTNKAVRVCGFILTATGTTPTVQFETGTKTTNPCDTGTATLSGAMAPTSGSVLAFGSAAIGASSFYGANSGELCIVTGGTGPSVQGILFYTQD